MNTAPPASRRHYLLLACVLSSAALADTPSGEEYGSSFPGTASGYEAPGTYSNPPAAQPYSQQGQTPSGWSGQTSKGNGSAYGSAGGGYGASQGYGSAQAGGVQGGSFKGRGTPQGGAVGNPYSSGKTFTKPPKGKPGTQGFDASAFGAGDGGSSTGSWADPYAPGSQP